MMDATLPTSTDDLTAAASRLCTACGLCCNGVLFHIVRLQPVDSMKQLESLGMKLSRKKKEPYFNQPCRFLHHCTCDIYEHRPIRCRLFECRQIQGLERGTISESEALDTITQTRQKVSHVESFIQSTPVDDSRRPLTERCQQALSILPGAEQASLQAAMTALEEDLQQHFRP